MSILIQGMPCPLCSLPIQKGQEVIGFPSFIPNRLDPLWVFNDGIFHSECLLKHSLADRVITRYEEFQKNSEPTHRQCEICKLEITNPDEYLGLGHLTDEESQEIHRYNYTNFHYSCLKHWNNKTHLYKLFEQLKHSKTWDDKDIQYFLRELNCENL